MKNYKVKTIVKKSYLDKNEEIIKEKGETITLNRARYEELYSKGFVEKGEILENKKKEEE